MVGIVSVIGFRTSVAEGLGAYYLFFRRKRDSSKISYWKHSAKNTAWSFK